MDLNDRHTLERLKSICTTGQKQARCDECCFVDPNHGDPHCIVITALDSRYKEKKSLYKLQVGTIPVECKYWISAKKDKERRESIQKLRHIQSLIDKLTLAEKEKIMSITHVYLVVYEDDISVAWTDPEEAIRNEFSYDLKEAGGIRLSHIDRLLTVEETAKEMLKQNARYPYLKKIEINPVKKEKIKDTI